jgi:hypothetical protein
VRLKAEKDARERNIKRSNHSALGNERSEVEEKCRNLVFQHFPVGRRKFDLPKARGGFCKLYGNLILTGFLLVHPNDAAMFFFPASHVLDDKRIVGSHFPGEQD